MKFYETFISSTNNHTLQRIKISSNFIMRFAFYHGSTNPGMEPKVWSYTTSRNYLSKSRLFGNWLFSENIIKLIIWLLAFICLDLTTAIVGLERKNNVVTFLLPNWFYNKSHHKISLFPFFSFSVSLQKYVV